MTQDWSIQEVAKLAGTTSRTLRHYDDIGLLRPSRIGSNAYRYYDADALAGLQRILLLRDLGLSLPAIAEVMAGQRDHVRALLAHAGWLEAERERLDRQLDSVNRTIHTMTEGGQLMAETMFDGFDHTQHREEVEQRWGAETYASSDAWWRAKTPSEKERYRTDADALAQDWRAAASAGLDPAGSVARALAVRQRDWLAQVPGTPGYPDGPTREYLLGLAELYVTDERFAATYGGAAGATFVRDALAAFAG